ncbi:M91 family zinc metallopeptidase [Prevotella sp. AM42-24]|uniref:M91 family zinc metallopeptidase n=1 Tax=Prevotella sp. AM42-24 TaxID=2293125 RepID=UPI002100FBD3|nr:M91 family zinc metallopeptidase [Prevotella sp. AM42-24]
MPSQVGLAHEMIHGDRSMRGVAIEYSESESYSYMNNRGQRVMETLSKEEAATVGLNHVKKNDITENDIRKDQGLNPRGAY